MAGHLGGLGALLLLATSAGADSEGDAVYVYGQPIVPVNEPFGRLGDEAEDETLPHSLDWIELSDRETLTPGRLEDLIDVIPGALPSSLNGGLSTALSIRGFGVSRMRWNGVPDIQRLFVRDLHTVERVEVLRGPEGVLEGLTSPGGSVRYIGKQPDFTAQHKAGLSAGERGSIRATLDSTGPLTDTIAYRIVSASQNGRTHPGGMTERRDHTLLGLKWNYLPGGQLGLESEYQYDARPFMFGTAAPGGRPIYDTVHASPDQRSARRYWRHGLTIAQKLPAGLDLAANYSRSSVRRNESLIGFWGIRNSDELWGYYTRYQDRYEQRNLRIEARGSFDAQGLTHRYVVGWDDNRHHIDFTGVQNWGGFTVDIQNPRFSALDVSALPLTQRFNHEHGRDKAWFAGLRSSLGDAVHLTLGYRRNQFRLSADRVGTGLQTASRFDLPTWHAGLSVSLAAELNVYASLATGAEPNRGKKRDGSFVPPQQSRQEELGIKWRREQLRLSSAIYRIRLENLTMRDPQDINALVSTGKREVKGIELGAGIAARAVRIDFAMNWLETRNVSRTATNQGDAFTNVPRFSGSARLSHLTPLASGHSIRIWAGALHVGRRYGNMENSFRVDSFRRYDAGAEYATTATQWWISIRNLADSRYVEAVSSESDVYQGPRRQIWIGMNHSL